jgi:hypothetical protein
MSSSDRFGVELVVFIQDFKYASQKLNGEGELCSGFGFESLMASRTVMFFRQLLQIFNRRRQIDSACVYNRCSRT